MTTSYHNFIGIDIGKFKNVAAVHNQKNTIKFDNNAAGWQQLFQEFSNQLCFLKFFAFYNFYL